MDRAPTSAQLRSLGAQLAKFVRSSEAAPFSAGAMQGVVADLTAGNSSLGLPLRDLVSRPAFRSLLPYAASGSGSVQRDALIQDISQIYKADVVKSIEAVINGFLECSSDSAVPAPRKTPAVEPDPWANDGSNATAAPSQPSAAVTSSATQNSATSYSPIPTKHAVGHKGLQRLRYGNRANDIDNSTTASPERAIDAIRHGGVFQRDSGHDEANRATRISYLLWALAAVGAGGFWFSTLPQAKSCQQLTEQLGPLPAEDSSFRSIIESSETRCSGNAGFLIQQAVLANYDKKYNEAISLLDKSISINPSDGDAFHWKSKFKSERGEKAAAIDDISKAIELQPSDASNYMQRGSIYQDLRQYQRALSDYDKAIELDPADPFAYLGRGHSLNDLDRYADAVASYSKAIEIDSSVSDFYAARANSLALLEQYQESLADANKAISFDSSNAWAYSVRGTTRSYLDDSNGACSDAKESKKLGLKEVLVQDKTISTDVRIKEACSPL